MFLERRTVSRKTPADGKLEISRITADAVTPIGSRLTVEWDGRAAAAALVMMTCTCAKGAGGQHEHVFLQSDLFRTLETGAEVDLTLHQDMHRVAVTPAR